MPLTTCASPQYIFSQCCLILKLWPAAFCCTIWGLLMQPYGDMEVVTYLLQYSAVPPHFLRVPLLPQHNYQGLHLLGNSVLDKPNTTTTSTTKTRCLQHFHAHYYHGRCGAAVLTAGTLQLYRCRRATRFFAWNAAEGRLRDQHGTPNMKAHACITYHHSCSWRSPTSTKRTMGLCGDCLNGCEEHSQSSYLLSASRGAHHCHARCAFHRCSLLPWQYRHLTPRRYPHYTTDLADLNSNTPPRYRGPFVG